MNDGLAWLSERQRDGGIDRLPLPHDLPGRLWLCGKHAIAQRTWADEWHTVVVLVERREIAGHYPEYVASLDAGGDRVVWHPIHDLHAPPLHEMIGLVDQIVVRLRDGEDVVMHCAAGMGRTGTTAACLLMSVGRPAAEALAAVAAARPGAGPEVGAQRDLVVEFETLRSEPGTGSDGA